MNENNRFSDLSEKLADIGGEGVNEILSDLEGFKSKKILQDMS